MDVLRAIGFVVALLVLAFCGSNPPQRNTYRERLSYLQSIALWLGVLAASLVAMFAIAQSA